MRSDEDSLRRHISDNVNDNVNDNKLLTPKLFDSSTLSLLDSSSLRLFVSNHKVLFFLNRPQRDINGSGLDNHVRFEEFIMARITPIDVIKGISGKYGRGSNEKCTKMCNGC